MASKTLSDPLTIHSPRILVLHGGGTNSQIFHLQCRALRTPLEEHFRLVFVDAPFPSPAGPDVQMVFSEFGPFKRWMGWRADDEPDDVDAAAVMGRLDAALEDAMRRDDDLGATGEWVGLLGFSQGGKMVASLLLREQLRKERGGKPGTPWRFGVILAGRAPPVALDEESLGVVGLADPTAVSAFGPEIYTRSQPVPVLKTPTVHVHGLRDPGLSLHRDLLKYYCDPETAKLVEWNGDHRVPIRTPDVTPVVDEILAAARKTGALP